jgi:histidyl-tRNA synthetase
VPLIDLDALRRAPLVRDPFDFLVAPDALGPAAQERAFAWLSRLGEHGIAVEMDFADRSLKAQMKRADRQGAGHVLIVGDAELQNGAAQLRNMATKEQREIALDGLVETLAQELDK